MINSLPFFVKDVYCYTQLIVNQVYVSIPLLLYSHIPTATIALVVGIFVLSKNRSTGAKIFFFLTFAFFIFTFGDLMEWFVFFGRGTVMFSRSIIEVADLSLFLLSSYLLFVLIKKRDVGLIYKIIWLLPIISFAGVLIFTINQNLSAYNWQICEVVENNLVGTYGYYMDILYLISALIFAIWSIIRGRGDRKRIVLASAAVCSFMVLFFVMEYVLTGYVFGNAFDYSYFVYAFFGMPILIAILAFMIVRYHTFNIKTYGSQVLILALIALIGSEFFFLQSLTATVLAAVTLVITGFIGINLMRSVKKEITMRERIEKQEKALEIANTKLKELDQLKSEFVSLATHQIRAPLSAIKGYLSEVFEGDFGPISKKLEQPLQIVSQSTENLVHIVGDFLSVSRFEQGKMDFKLAPLNMKTVVEETLENLKPNFTKAGLELKIEMSEGDYNVYADVGKLKEVITNLVDNSIKYTPHGSIKVSLKSDIKNQKVLFAISDTGIGIPAEVIPKLFQKFTRAKDANEVNIIGTGLGLYVARLFIEGQHGRVWAESEGKGKGSQFYVELPVAHVS